MAGKGTKDPLDMEISEIPMPETELTEDLVESLDNAPDAGQGTTGKSGRTEEKAEAPAPDVATLDFLSPAESREGLVKLNHPFKLDGEPVTEMPVRRLTVAEVGQIVTNAGSGSLDYYDIYAAQTGFPAAVLRGLMDDDGKAVADRCRDFFPRAFLPDE